MKNLLTILIVLFVAQTGFGQSNVSSTPIPQKYSKIDTISFVFDHYDNYYFLYIINPTEDTISYQAEKVRKPFLDEQELGEEGWVNERLFICYSATKKYLIPPRKCELIIQNYVNTKADYFKYGLRCFNQNKRKELLLWSESIERRK